MSEVPRVLQSEAPTHPLPPPTLPSGWLSSEDDPMGIVTRVDQRIGDVTGLTMETAEQLQVWAGLCVGTVVAL